MNPLRGSAYEKLLLVLSLGLTAASLAWWLRAREALGKPGGHTEVLAPAAAPYVAQTRPRPEAVETRWLKPAPQSKGGGWYFEIFTPPIVHAVADGSFAVAPPQERAWEGGTVAGPELLAVRLEPYRLQLQGYCGQPGDLAGIFVSSQLPETLLGRAGRRFDALGLTLMSIGVRNVATAGEWGPGHDIAGLAVVREDSGVEVELDSRAPRLTDTTLAVLRLPDAADEPREFREGDTFIAGGTTYRVARIRVDPPEVVVAPMPPFPTGAGTAVLRLAKRGHGPASPPEPPVPEIAATVARNE